MLPASGQFEAVALRKCVSCREVLPQPTAVAGVRSFPGPSMAAFQDLFSVSPSRLNESRAKTRRLPNGASDGSAGRRRAQLTSLSPKKVATTLTRSCVGESRLKPRIGLWLRCWAKCLKTEAGGDGGIRTLDRALQPYNGLANRRLQPLGHVSGSGRYARRRGEPQAAD